MQNGIPSKAVQESPGGGCDPNHPAPHPTRKNSVGAEDAEEKNLT